METRPNNRDEVVRLLYGVFRLPDESYIVTVKLLLIYDWLEPVAGSGTFERLRLMRAGLKRMSNQRKVDMIYRMAEHELLMKNGRYAPKDARVPQDRQKYVSGWLPW